MNKAALKKGIFSALNASAHALTNLRELYLQDNKFTYIARSNIPHLPNLELLDIRRNHLQSITQLAFGNLPGLKSLILAENRISSIGSDNLGHNHGSLQQLEVLNLERNNITRIDPKAFDNLPRLKSLLLGWNEADVQSLFMGGESELMYLGIQQDHNQSCIKPLLYSKLKKLRWLMPDAYNLILLRPDASLLERDPYLLSLVKHCHPGTVITNRETYGLRDFAGVTIHDADDEGLNYPVQIAFLPLTYCPEAAYINTLSSLICSSSSSSSGLHWWLGECCSTWVSTAIFLWYRRQMCALDSHSQHSVFNTYNATNGEFVQLATIPSQVFPPPGGTKKVWFSLQRCSDRLTQSKTRTFVSTMKTRIH